MAAVAGAPPIDATHEPALRSSVESANGHREFPIQNLPLGVFSSRDGVSRGGVAIGDSILDLAAAVSAGLLAGAAATAAAGSTLNAYLALPSAARQTLRHQLSALLRHDSPQRASLQRHAATALHDARHCAMHLPTAIGNFTDGMASLHHVTRAGRQVRPDNPVFPNFRYVPVAYHSRASSVRPSGVPVTRPCGQFLPPGASVPTFGACEQLDYEAEVGLWMAGENALGEAISVATANQRIAAFSLLNDWSARDIQRWETQPLGPFLGKSFHTTVSPWLVSAEALAPFRVPLAPHAASDPAPLPHLSDAGDQAWGGVAMEVATWLLTPRMAAAGAVPERLARASLRDLYWSPAQLIAHHTSNGCNLCPGDLVGTGTVSGPEEAEAGCLLELTRRGQQPLTLANGERRAWLLDGDTLILRGRCERDGYAAIGFGDCAARISAARVPLVAGA